MKKALVIMGFMTIFPRLLVAQELDIQSLVGEQWYGLYLKGQKAGYASSALAVDDEGNVTVNEDSSFQVTMLGVRQMMSIDSERVYAPDGALRRIEMVVEDITGKSEFHAVVDGEKMLLRKVVAGVPSEVEFPKPKESLKDALGQVPLVADGAKPGDSLSFSLFDPVFAREIEGESRILAIEDRLFDGAPTKVFKIKSLMKETGIETVSYVSEDGTIMEDVVANFITMRLEPKEMAQDVNYNNDVIVSNAAMLKSPIENPRERNSLALVLKGPLDTAHLYNDERQFMGPKDDAFEFRATKIALDGFEPAMLPIENEEVKKWLEPSQFVQSDAPEIVAKAREIVAEEANSLAIANKLCAWVYENVRTTYSAQLTNALQVLQHMEGDCTEHSVLFVGLARAAGVPAREVAGLVYVGGSRPGFYFHQWAKVWVGKWIDVDPTFNQPLADVTHIKLAEGDLYEQTKLIPIIGQIRVELPGEAGGEEAASAQEAGS
jgi:hypothetical protein